MEITVLFADLSSFTEMTHDLGAQRTHEVVDAFLRMATDVLVRQGAFIDKYIGDAVMALFNVPIRHEDHARRAILAATDLNAELQNLRARLSFLSKLPSASLPVTLASAGSAPKTTKTTRPSATWSISPPAFKAKQAQEKY